MPIERETIVTGNGGSPFGIIAGVIAAVVAVLLIVWLLNGGISTNGEAVNVDLPEVTVTD